MGRAPCCDKENVKRGPWSPEEDTKLKDFIHKYGTGGNWISLPQKAELKRCGKSCRLRWLNYLRPNIKHGQFSDEEDGIICTLFSTIGSRWSVIAAQLPGRTDNDIKNYWNTKLKKKLLMKAMLFNNTNHYNLSSAHNTSKFQTYSLPPPPPPSLPSLPDNVSPELPYRHCPSYTNYYHYSSSLATGSSLLDQIQDQESLFSYSSSDGSCSQIMSKEIKQEDVVLQSYMMSSNGAIEDNQKFYNNAIDDNNMITSTTAWIDQQKPDGYFGNSGTSTTTNSPLEDYYEAEEDKQMIISSTSTTSGYCNNSFSRVGGSEQTNFFCWPNYSVVEF